MPMLRCWTEEVVGYWIPDSLLVRFIRSGVHITGPASAMRVGDLAPTEPGSDGIESILRITKIEVREGTAAEEKIPGGN